MLIFFTLAVALASSDVGLAIGDAPGTTWRNAPIVVARLMPVLSLLGLFAITAFVANAALRDFEQRSDMLFFTKPITKADYGIGRFAGSIAISGCVLGAALLGLLVGNWMPWQAADRLGPLALSPYLFGGLVIFLPNLLTMGALFFALAIWSRRLTLTYLGVVFFIGMQDAVEVVAERLDGHVLGSLLEPSGIIALETMARYWTVAEQNTRLPEFSGLLLANRLLWLGLAFGLLALSFSKFELAGSERKRRRPRKTSAKLVTAAVQNTASASAKVERLRVQPDFSLVQAWRQLLRQTRIEVSEVILRAPFLALFAFGLMFILAYSSVAGNSFGMPSYPLTHLMLQAIQLGVRLTLAIILVVYAGEVMFSQRSLKIAAVYDACPVSNGVLMMAKVFALFAVIGTFLLVATLSTLLMQLAKGFSGIDLGLYLRGLLLQAWPLALLAVLMLFFQVLTNHKLWGILLGSLALLLRFALPRLGFENHLYLFAAHPRMVYTAFNDYGHHVESFISFMIYWSFGALILLVLMLLLWPRGTTVGLKERFAIARQRLMRPAQGAIASGLVGMLAVGSWIFYNISLRNDYLDRDLLRQKLADYEQQYHPYREMLLPRITSVFAEVDLFPGSRQVTIRGEYLLENQGEEPIRILPITISPRWVEGVLPVYGGVSLKEISLPAHRVVVADEALGFHVFELEQPLASGETLEFGFVMQIDHGGFTNNRHNNLVVANGTFFSNRNFLPYLGYARSQELRDPTDRSRRGLGPTEREAEREDRTAHQRNYLEADWIAFETVISTDEEQMALAPGDLVEEWKENERRYFRYRTSAPMVDLLPFLSGKYEVRTERWGHVDLEVYFHPEHGDNIDHFLEVTRRTLAYLTETLGPYPHDQLRIVEIPSYHGEVAFSLPQMILFSEVWGFTTDLESAEPDGLAAILAHEVAHQWWNHQVVPADVEGATWIAESLPQYAAIKILEDMYGKEAVGDFLKFQLDRYLEGRGKERLREMPLAQVENQAYVHYNKASLAWYNLEAAIGEEALNRAMRGFLEDYRFAGPPYPTSHDLLQHLRRETPNEKQGLIIDLFETITLFDHRITAAQFSEQQDGTFVVEVEISSRKLRDDGDGVVQEMVIDDEVDVAIYGEMGRLGDRGKAKVLHLERSRLQKPKTTLWIAVDERPTHVVVDPYHQQIDRDSGDNRRNLVQINR